MLNLINFKIINISTKYINNLLNNPLNLRDRVYFCYEILNQNNCMSIIGFNCIKYYLFEQTNNSYWKYNISENIEYSSRRHTIIHISKWAPEILDKHILNYKLKNIYWGGKIKIL